MIRVQYTVSHADRGAEMARRKRSLDQLMEERGRAEAEDEIYTDRSLSEKGTRGDGASRGPMWERASYLCINELAVSACLFRSWPFRLCPNLHRGMHVYLKETKSSDEGIAGTIDCICMKPARNSLGINAENIVSTLSMTYPHKAPIQAH